MPKRRRYSLRKRHFLERLPAEHNSYVSVACESSQAGTYPYGDNLVLIADCKRAVELEFFLGNSAARKASLRKIDGLLNTLTQFRNALYKENELIEKARRAK